MRLQHLFFILPLVFFSPMSSFAGLGDHESTLELEAQNLGALRTVVQRPLFRVHDLVMSQNRVKEFVDADGQVFAVAWHGLNALDTAKVLGKFEMEFRVGLATQVHFPGRRFLSVRTSSVEVFQHGMMGNLQGVAYLIGKIPAGVSVDDLK